VAVEVVEVASPEDAGALVAARIIDRCSATTGDVVLGLPTGRTPMTTYAALTGARPPRLVAVMMDEFVPVEREAHYSCHRFVDEHVRPIAERVLIPDPDDPAGYEEQIAALGGIDLFVLATGASDGHVAFNGPGTDAASRTRVVDLAESTRRDNLATFPAFTTIDEVPRRGVTVGLATIAEAREAVLVVLGADKAPALARILAADDFDRSWPATIIHRCARPSIVADAAALRA
jgi:glucosamine-6-phosphate deaminase